MVRDGRARIEKNRIEQIAKIEAIKLFRIIQRECIHSQLTKHILRVEFEIYF